MNTLQNNVIHQLGYDELDTECLDTLSDVTEHGAGVGFGQFIYYSDTVKFFDDNRRDILLAVDDMAEQFGSDPVNMVREFICLNGNFNNEVYQVMTGIDCDDDIQVKNALAWFALEETARELTNE